MKCEDCGEEIVVVHELVGATDEAGHITGSVSIREFYADVRCGCYDGEGFDSCPYDICDGLVKRKPPPPPPPPEIAMLVRATESLIPARCIYGRTPRVSMHIPEGE